MKGEHCVKLRCASSSRSYTSHNAIHKTSCWVQKEYEINWLRLWLNDKWRYPWYDAGNISCEDSCLELGSEPRCSLRTGSFFFKNCNLWCNMTCFCFRSKEYLESAQRAVPIQSELSLKPRLEKAISDNSLYGTDVVLEDQRQLIRGLGEHVILGKSVSQSVSQYSHVSLMGGEVALAKTFQTSALLQFS